MFVDDRDTIGCSSENPSQFAPTTNIRHIIRPEHAEDLLPDALDAAEGPNTGWLSWRVTYTFESAFNRVHSRNKFISYRYSRIYHQRVNIDDQVFREAAGEEEDIAFVEGGGTTEWYSYEN